MPKLSAETGAGREVGVQSPYLVWDAGGRFPIVHLALEVIENLGISAARTGVTAGEEIGGLLLGRIEPGGVPVTLVDGFEPLSSEHLRGAAFTLSARNRKRLAARLARKGGPEVVGFYRSHARAGLYLDRDDMAVLDTFFSRAEQVCLVFRKEEGSAGQGGFFIWEGGAIRTQAPYAAFPFDRAAITSAALATVMRQGRQVRVAAPALRLPSMAAAAGRLVDAVPRGSGWAKATGMAALALVAGGVAFQQLRSSAPREANAAATLALTVDRRGESLRLSWDRNSKLVKDAKSASVSITDGQNVYRVDLAPKQLGLGSMTYFPKSPQASFEMQVSADGRKWSESVQVFAPPAAAAELTPPAPAPAPPSPLPAGEEVRQATSADRAEEPKPEAVPRGVEVPRHARERRATQPPAPRDFRFEPAAPEVSAAMLEPPPAAFARIPGRAPALAAPKVYREAAVSYEPAESSRKTRRLIGKVLGLREAKRAFVPAQPVRQVRPRFPARASFGPEGSGQVSLKVYIDSSGKVTRVESADRRPHGMAGDAAAGAARQWEFEPARLNGKPVPSEMLLRFDFDGRG